MKQVSFVIFLFLSTFCASDLRAQNSKYLSIDKFNIPLDAVIITDSSAGGRLAYFAHMEIAVRDNDNVSALRMLYAGLSENRQINLSIRTVDINSKILEERFYQAATVQEIMLPAVDGADKNVIKIQVRIRASSLSLKENTGNLSPQGGKGVSAVGSNFRLSIGSLPTKRISKIGAVRISGGQPSSFSIELAETDARDWQNWLFNGAVKKQNGVIEWLAPNFKDVIFQIDLRDIDITSTSSQYNSLDGRAISRVSVGLRARVVPGGGK